MAFQMQVQVLRCPLFTVCQNSMARVCTCELLSAQVARGGAILLNPRSAENQVKPEK